MALKKNNKSGPLSDTEVDGFMTTIGPFESEPHIAVAVSGGIDSLALTVLCKKWVDKHGGKLSAISVDHGLRKGSDDEIKQLEEWLGARNIEHTKLYWKGDKPQKGIQEAARIARYDLLENWCWKNGVLHLLLGHQQDDQAETFLLRLAHNSRVDGLAGMSRIVEKSHVRILRPLLSIPKHRLRATLKAVSQPWLEDPSNENEKFERIRIRKALPTLVGLGLTSEKICETTDSMAQIRVSLEAEASKLLAKSCYVGSAGYIIFNAVNFFSAPKEILLRALIRILLCVGGGVYPARLIKLERLYEKMRAALRDANFTWKGATLGGCRILLIKSRQGAVNFLFCREERMLPEPLLVSGSIIIEWDKRFQLHLTKSENKEDLKMKIEPLGQKGWKDLCKVYPSIENVQVPVEASITLPTLFDDEGILTVPNLNYNRHSSSLANLCFTKSVFHPRQTLSGRGFTVAK